MIERLTQRLFSSKSATSSTGNDQRQIHKTMAELIKEFHSKTRVYDNKENPNQTSKVKSWARVIPRSPKLLSVNRNRPRNVLSRLEQEELIGENIKKNTFKANPINKKIFEKCPTTTHAAHKSEAKPPLKFVEFNFRMDARLESRKAKDEPDHSERFVFKARPMPQFKSIPIQMRQHKKQSCTGALKKQVSDTKMVTVNSNTELLKPKVLPVAGEPVSGEVSQPQTIQELALECTATEEVETIQVPETKAMLKCETQPTTEQVPQLDVVVHDSPAGVEIVSEFEVVDEESDKLAEL